MSNWDVVWEAVYIVVGAILASVLGLAADAYKRSRDKKDMIKQADFLLSLLFFEAKQGVHRCESLDIMFQDDRLSPTRVYTTLWDSVCPDLPKYALLLKLPNDVLAHFHRLYYRFSLVNFNMDAGRFSKGAVFARDYLDKMKGDLDKIEVVFKARGIYIE